MKKYNMYTNNPIKACFLSSKVKWFFTMVYIINNCEKKNTICIPESFNSNISHQLLTTQYPLWIKTARTQIHKVICTQKPVLKDRFKDSGIQKKYDSDLLWQI